MEGTYSVKRKNADGKFWSYGNVKKNKYGNYSLGFKVTPELKAIVASIPDGEWLNFSMFADDGNKPTENRSKPESATEALPFQDGAEIPF